MINQSVRIDFRYAVFFLLGMALCGPAWSASCTDIACSSQVSKIFPWAPSTGGKRVNLQLAGVKTGVLDPNCTLKSNVYFTLHDSHPQYDELFQLAQTALVEGLSLTARVVENSSDCKISYLTLNRAYSLADDPNKDNAQLVGGIRDVNAGPENYFGFRAYLDLPDPNANGQCNAAFTYIEDQPGNGYQAKISSLLTAFSTGKQIRATVESGRSNYCKLINVTVFGD